MWDDPYNERFSFPQTAKSVFDPIVRMKITEMARLTSEIFITYIRARENAPPQVTGHETD